MSDTQKHAELLRLLDAWCDERIDGQQFARLTEILRDDVAAQETYFEYVDLHLELGRLIGNRPETESPAEKDRQHVSLRWYRAHRWAAAAGALAAVLLLAVYVYQRGTEDVNASRPTITRLVGTVLVQVAEAQPTPARTNANLLIGERIITQGQGALAVLSYDDGTQFTLVNDATASCADDSRKNVNLHRGVASIQVAPQPAGRPMLVSTPDADIEVIGTRFAVAAEPDRTELNVATGRVKLTRKSDGQSVDVNQGETVVTKTRIPLTVQTSGAQATWSVDFEAGIPVGWTGDPVTSNLPTGSRGGVAPMVQLNSEPRTHVIATRDEWVAGLFEIHDDSHLHITLKMDRPDWLNVFFSSRDADPTQPNWALHIFNEVPFFPPQPGQWRTISIPLNRFRRKRNGVFHEEPPVVGEVVYSLSISFTEADRGLVVDRMWVTRGGPGKVEWEPVE